MVDKSVNNPIHRGKIDSDKVEETAIRIWGKMCPNCHNRFKGDKCPTCGIESKNVL